MSVDGECVVHKSLDRQDAYRNKAFDGLDAALHGRKGQPFGGWAESWEHKGRFHDGRCKDNDSCRVQ